MKKFALLSLSIGLSIFISSCASKKKAPSVAVDETAWPVKKRLHSRYYNNLKQCLSNSTSADAKFVSECLGGGFLLNIGANKSAADLNINNVKQLSYSETDETANTVLLVNAADSLYLEVDYKNCVYCPLKATSFELFYRSMGLKSKVIGGSGF